MIKTNIALCTSIYFLIVKYAKKIICISVEIDARKNAFVFSTFIERNLLKFLYNRKKTKQIFYVSISTQLDTIASPINKPK